jgi:hypothetical protein
VGHELRVAELHTFEEAAHLAQPCLAELTWFAGCLFAGCLYKGEIAGLMVA